MRNKTVINAIQEFIEGKAYFSVNALKMDLDNMRIPYKDRTVIQHLYNMRDASKIFNSGYGWYSTIPNSVIDMDIPSIINLAQIISDKYPFLDFSIWSTRQIFNYFHHLPARHLILIYTDPDALHSLFDFLIDKKYVVYNNPTKEILNRHWVPDVDTVILRPPISQAPVSGTGLRPEISQAPVPGTGFMNFATMEKILVDLYLEKDRLMYLDGAEFKRILENILFTNRINIPALLRYAGRREVREKLEKLLFKENEKGIIINLYRRLN